MKGIIFTEFLEMAEEKFGYEIVDEILENAKDPHNGAYTSVGTYGHSHLVQLIVELHKKTNVPLEVLLSTYGEYLFPKLVKSHPDLLKGITGTFQLLMNVDGLIHSEVRKLYPEANPPQIKGEQIDAYTMKVRYDSHRSMGDVAIGLMHGCAAYFGEKLEIEKLDDEGNSVLFLVKKVLDE